MNWFAVTKQAKLSSRLNTTWSQALSTSYPTRTSLVVNRDATNNATIYPTGQNQAVDPRSSQTGFWNISTSSNTGSVMGGPVIGGNNITYASGVNPVYLFILGGAILLWIWR